MYWIELCIELDIQDVSHYHSVSLGSVNPSTLLTRCLA